jgi:hypothetical protein
MLRRARGNRLSVHASARDAAGATATTTLNLIAFGTSGPGPKRTTTNASTLQIIGGSDFVSARGVGGILAGCMGATGSCQTTTTIAVGSTVIARTGPELIGSNEAGYLIFRLTAAGRSLLAHARGNELGAQVAISDGASSATATVALVAYK